MIAKKSLVEKLQSMYSFENVYEGYHQISINLTTRQFSADEEMFVEEEWKNLIAQGKVKYSSAIAAVDPVTIFVRDGTLYLNAYSSDFKHYRTTLISPIVKVWLTGPSGVIRAHTKNETWYIFG